MLFICQVWSFSRQSKSFFSVHSPDVLLSLTSRVTFILHKMHGKHCIQQAIPLAQKARNIYTGLVNQKLMIQLLLFSITTNSVPSKTVRKGNS